MALPVSPCSEELLPSVSISFSSKRGTPSVLMIDEVSKDANEPAKARQDGVWLELPPLSVVVKVLSDGSLLRMVLVCRPLPSTEAADPDRKLVDPV